MASPPAASSASDYSTDKSRTVRQQPIEAAGLYQAVANLRLVASPEVADVADAPAPVSEIETQIIVARTQADIISNASQALLAQANVGPQSVIELLEA